MQRDVPAASCAVAFAKLIIFLFSTVLLLQGMVTLFLGFGSYGVATRWVGVDSFFTDLVPDYLSVVRLCSVMATGLVMASWSSPESNVTFTPPNSVSFVTVPTPRGSVPMSFHQLTS